MDLWFRFFLVYIAGNDDLSNGLSNLNKLRRAGFRMYFKLSTFCPLVRLVVVVDVAEQEVVARCVNNQSDVSIDPHRSEIGILRLIKLVELQAGLRRVDLKIERSRLGGFLFLVGQAIQTGCKDICDGELHAYGLSCR